MNDKWYNTFMFGKRKKSVIVGQVSAVGKIFALRNVRDCKEFVFESFKWLRQNKDNIAFLSVEKKEKKDETDPNYVIIRADLYKDMLASLLELEKAQEDIYYIKEIIKGMEKEENS